MSSQRDDLIRMDRKRLEKFHQKCREKCKTRKKFLDGLEVDRSHILEGHFKNPKRFSLSNEHIAAIIHHGKLLIDKSNARNEVEIAVAGVFKNYEWTEFGSGTVRKITENHVRVRVVVRERSKKKKDLVVTAYVEDVTVSDLTELPEVSYELW